MEPTDGELLDAWKRGDRGAARQLLGRHYDALARFFRNKVGDDGPDLIQRTMLACVESRERFRGEASFRTYLFAIARNELCAYFRGRGRAREVDPRTDSVADLGPGPSTALGQRQEQRVLLEALRRVSIDGQIALELYYWEGMTSREIAEVLGVPHGTVRSRLRLARDSLEAEMSAVERGRKVLESTAGGIDGWLQSVRGRLDRDEAHRLTQRQRTKS